MDPLRIMIYPPKEALPIDLNTESALCLKMAQKWANCKHVALRAKQELKI